MYVGFQHVKQIETEGGYFHRNEVEGRYGTEPRLILLPISFLVME